MEKLSQGRTAKSCRPFMGVKMTLRMLITGDQRAALVQNDVITSHVFLTFFKVS
jgi:hypothetical protein